ncbi:MAG: succinate dehydrogenase, hydrophobic membrane anchor protein [Pseudomonadota bacterium]|nr:succinate dehydrogenase, hydrophobic membrane anchor protein [Pseudomonadota bacterium]
MKPGFTGLAAWWVQRASAVGMLLLVLFLLASFALEPAHNYVEWKAWVGRPDSAVGLMGFFGALLAHLWVGLRDVLLDYARPPGLQRALLGAVAAGLVALGGWVFWILVQAQR